MGLLQVWEIVKQKQSKAVWVQILQSNSPHLFLQRVHGGQSRRGSEMDMCNVLGETGARETIEIKWGGSSLTMLHRSHFVHAQTHVCKPVGKPRTDTYICSISVL